MEFKDLFVTFIDKILDIDKDNKYAIKYKENIENLKYKDISKFIYDKIQTNEKLDNITYEDFIPFIKKINDESFIPGFDNKFIVSLNNDELFKIYYDLIQYANLDNFKIVTKNTTITDIEENIEKTREELVKQIEKTKPLTDSDDMMDAVLNMVDTDALNDRIKNLTDDDLNKMGDQVTKILGGNESSKLIGEMVNTIGHELKSQTLEGGKLSDQIKLIADKVSDAYINGTKKTTDKEVTELYNNTQKFVNQFKNQPLDVNMVNSVLKQYGINKKVTQNDINSACKQMGINQNQLFNSNRKMKRKVQQKMQKGKPKQK